MIPFPTCTATELKEEEEQGLTSRAKWRSMRSESALKVALKCPIPRSLPPGSFPWSSLLTNLRLPCKDTCKCNLASIP